MGAKPGILRNLRVKRVALVDMGANYDGSTGDGAHIMLFKRADMNKDAGLGAVHVDRPIGKEGDTEEQYGCPCPDCDGADLEEYEKADLNAESRSKIPDSKFLAVWTDAQGKKHRKLPVHDAGHLAAARGRIDQAQMPADVKAAAHRKLEHLTSQHKENPVAKSAFGKLFERFTKATAETDVTKRQAEIDALIKEADSMSTGGDEDTGAAVTAMQNMHKQLGDKLTAMGPGPHPDGHPYHKLNAMHKAMGEALKAAGCEVATDEPGVNAMSHEVGKKLTDLEKRNADLEKRLNEEVTKREEGEMYTLLKSFKATPFKLDGDDSDVKKFVSMKKNDSTGFDRMMAIFKAADAQLATSKLFANVGASGEAAAGSAYAEAEALAEKLMEKKAGENLTKEQAIEKVFEANPSLYTRYVGEQQ